MAGDIACKRAVSYRAAVSADAAAGAAERGSVEVVRAALASLDSAADLGAVVDRNDEAVLARALASPLRMDLPLSARTITVKDWIDVIGFVCESESPVPTGRRPERDATAVARLRAAGATIVAKTQPGADHPIHGRCHHPDDPLRTPGGSSSGEASLIGRGASTLGLGSDSGGSIRLPAAWCGVIGFKPTYGLVPGTGHVPSIGGHSDGRTVIGPLATNVADIATTVGVIAGPDAIDGACIPMQLGDPRSVQLAGLRVALLAPDPSWPVGPSTGAAVVAAARVLEQSGAVVIDTDLQVDLSESLDITQRYWSRDRSSGLEVDRQLRDWDRFTRRILRTTVDIDVALMPVVQDVAPLARPLVGEDYVFTLPWSLTGWPAISMPMGEDPSTGLPVAVQVVAPRWHDHVVIAVATALEAERANSSRPG